MQLQRPVIAFVLSLLCAAPLAAQPAPLRASGYPAGVTAPLFVFPASAVTGGGSFKSQLIGPAADNTAAPPFTFLGDLTTGYASSATGTLDLVTAGTSRVKVNAKGVGVGATIPSATTAFTPLFVGNSAMQAQTTNGGGFDVGWNFYYNSGYKYRITDTAGKLGYNAGAAGAFDMQIASSGTADAAITFVSMMRWSTAGTTALNHFLFSADNTYDIGASGATRPRNEYIASGIYVGSVAVASGFGSGAAFATGSVASSFDLNVGTTAGSSGVVTLPTAAHGWTCRIDDITTIADRTYVSANSTTSATFTTTIGWTNSDHLVGSCTPY